MSKQSVTQCSYLYSFASLLTLLLIGCCTTSFASQNISDPHTNSDSEKQREQCYEPTNQIKDEKASDFINRCINRWKLWEQYNDLTTSIIVKRAAHINDCVSQLNDIIQSWMALRKTYLDLGLSTDYIDSCIKQEIDRLKFFKDFQTLYFNADKYEYCEYGYELVEKRK